METKDLDVKMVPVRMSAELHMAVRLRAIREQTSMQALARQWFTLYADGHDVIGVRQPVEWVRLEGGELDLPTPPETAQGGSAAGEQVGDRGLGADGQSLDVESTPDGANVARDPAPAAKPCRRQHLHHLNHRGKPCPECGWPA